MKRRSFLKYAALTGSMTLIRPMRAFSLRGREMGEYFSVHPFVENNPDAVFIMKTAVEKKTDAVRIKETGKIFGRSVFGLTNDSAIGIPLSNKIVVKPNLTRRYKDKPQYTVEGTMGIVTDSHFIEGIFESMKEIGLKEFYLREVHCDETEWEHGDYWGVAERTGADLQNLDQNIEGMPPEHVHWVDVPNGQYFRKIPYLWPVNAPGSWLLNVAKMKSHGMGLTLCAKNIQGTNVKEYQGHCRSFTSFASKRGIAEANVHSNAVTEITKQYQQHLEQKIPRWDKSNDSLTGLSMEIWAQRCLDNNSVTKSGLHIIEGIYSRDGNFINGPHASDGRIDLNNKKNLAKDFMSNIIIFGKNPFYVDIVGHWLGGHEPGNLGLFHLAMERGFIDFINPMDIPVYEWKSDGTASRTPLDNFEKTPLLTYYLQRNYEGQTEPYWHLLDEPFDYRPFSSVNPNFYGSDNPTSFVLDQNFPNPFNNRTAIQYSIPRAGNVRIEIFNTHGEIVDILVNGFHVPGNHLAHWDSPNVASGTYFYRLSFDGFSEVKRMLLVK